METPRDGAAPRTDFVAGCRTLLGVVVGLRALEAEAAVGFERRLITPSKACEGIVLCAVLGNAGSPRARARDAFVGAYIPEAGVLGRAGVAGVGVFAREVSTFDVFG